ncbi:MAG: RagB/SusD family nutrient uptake outer membrane protein [Chitinophaga sp.]|nr:RagB/SusD family nutrient uptake outer membrane protein [Chitinophaga sp.]
MAGLYLTLANFSATSLPVITTSCSADELIDYTDSYTDYYTNNIKVDDAWNDLIWSGYYSTIYNANAILEALENNSALSGGFKTQISGEALFIRAYCYFQLVNLYGDIPLLTSTKVNLNATTPRTSTSIVYTQIISDLKNAQGSLSDAYVTKERVRANKSAATALLARIYLYNKKWEDAETQATAVINNPQYALCTDLDSVFLANNQESILQLWVQNGYTDLAAQIIPSFNPLLTYIPSFIDSLEPGDKRQEKWIDSLPYNGVTYYYPYKYKLNGTPTSSSEYFVVMRLAELYLIRAEARINNNKIADGVKDLNILRNRARQTPSISIPNPLPDLPLNLSLNNALAAVAKERKNELSSEECHRWFDLKRTGGINSISSQKPGNWRANVSAYPVPLIEISANPTLVQNPGYN